MNKLIEARLNEYKISSEMILDKLDVNSDSAIFIYSSHLEGLGNKYSDFDLYVVYKENSYHGDKILNKNINGINFDIEMWNANEIYQIIKNIDKGEALDVTMDQLKLVNRLRVSEILNGDILAQKIKAKIDIVKLNRVIAETYFILCKSTLNDAIKLYESDEIECALVCANEALEDAIGAYCAKNNRPILKKKWLPKVFMEISNSNIDIRDKYIEYQINPYIRKENFKKFVEGKLEFIQNILSQLVIKEL